MRKLHLSYALRWRRGSINSRWF